MNKMPQFYMIFARKIHFPFAVVFCVQVFVILHPFLGYRDLSGFRVLHNADDDDDDDEMLPHPVPRFLRL